MTQILDLVYLIPSLPPTVLKVNSKQSVQEAMNGSDGIWLLLDECKDAD